MNPEPTNIYVYLPVAISASGLSVSVIVIPSVGVGYVIVGWKLADINPNVISGMGSSVVRVSLAAVSMCFMVSVVTFCVVDATIFVSGPNFILSYFDVASLVSSSCCVVSNVGSWTDA